jgi:phosphopantothenoylcysteine synthetase/decarboxylase
VCPATFNTINKLAAGICDNLALGLLTEALGTGAPLVIAPALNTNQAGHPAFARSVDELRAAGVVVLYGPGIYEPVAKGAGRRPYRWDRALDAIDGLVHS